MLENKGKTEMNGRGQVTPIQLAVLLGNTKIVGLFIEHGGLGQTVTTTNEKEEEIYEGIKNLNFMGNFSIFSVFWGFSKDFHRFEYWRKKNGLGRKTSCI